MDSIHKNADRFTGFADVYDAARPQMPLFPTEVIKTYLGREPDAVVDLGCGTGLSSLIWKGRCRKVIGIEPSDDMRREALRKESRWFSVRKAISHSTGLPDASADAVVCSQSFHWMEPSATLCEVGRILKPGGVFATVDCDWPPVYDWRAERAYRALFREVERLEQTVPSLRQSFCRYEKAKHLAQIQACGQFRFAREIVFSNTETCTPRRLSLLARSQGGLQGVLRYDPGLIAGLLENFEQSLRALDQREYPAVFCYRMRIGVK